MDAAWNAMAGFGQPQQGQAGQGAAPTYYPTAEQEMAVARAQMFDSVHHLSTSLRNAANQCDNFVKIISRHHPSAAATAFASNVGADFLALASGTALAGLAPPIMPTSRKNMTKEERRALKKHRKLTRDPNAPKRPPSAYLLFQNEIREDMRHQFKDLSYAEVLGKISEAWKGLSDEQRKVYQDRTIEMMKEWNDYRRNHQGPHNAFGMTTAPPPQQQQQHHQAQDGLEAAAAAAAASNQLLAANGAAANVLQSLAPQAMQAQAAMPQQQQQQQVAPPVKRKKEKGEKKSRKSHS